MVEDLVRAGEHAGDVRADGDDVPAYGLGVEHVVEGRGPPHLGGGAPEKIGDVLHRLFAQPAVLGLGQVAERDQGGATPWVAGHDGLGPGAVVGGQVGHQRSTSPMTGSTEEMTATASAISPPRRSGGSAWRFTKLGALMCIR